jgi:uncharacterized protein (DUF1499 family)
MADAGLFQLWMEGRRGAVPSLTAVLVALAVLSPFIVSAWRVYAYPQLADVSTDLADPPPLEEAARERTDRMNPVAPITAANAEAQVESYPEITGRRYQLSADRVLQLAEGLVAAKGWTVLRRTVPLAGADSVIEAEARTMLLALPVDVSIRVSEEGDTSYVDMRSAWRFGRHDFGDNAARIADFLTALDGAVAGAAGMSPREEPGALPVAPDGEIPVPSEPPAD